MDFLQGDNFVQAFSQTAITAALLFWRRLNIKHGGLWGLCLAKVGDCFCLYLVTRLHFAGITCYLCMLVFFLMQSY